jgi:hypothetical protein
MNLHEDIDLFSEIILRACQPKETGGLGINAGFIEKDYWITRSLQQLSRSSSVEYAIFKGGTSLSKIYHIGSRFSEDIDIAIVKDDDVSDAKLKNIIRITQKSMSAGLEELVKPGLTSKGSRYRKVYFSYPLIEGLLPIGGLLSGQLLIEINSFANPIPYAKHTVSNFIREYFVKSGYNDIISEFDMDSFEINVLDKRTTLIEKLVSIIRFSMSDNVKVDLSSKIRHFYDLYYLCMDSECIAFIESDDFMDTFNQLFEHDRKLFKNPIGWQQRMLTESVLITDLQGVWNVLKSKYMQELPSLAYSAIPGSSEIFDRIKYLINRVESSIL